MDLGYEPRQLGPESLCFALSDSLPSGWGNPPCVSHLFHNRRARLALAPGRNTEGPSLQRLRLHSRAEGGSQGGAFKAEEEASLEAETRLDFEEVLV